MKDIKLDRKKLYDEIWKISVKGVSKKYNIPYHKIKEICEEFKILTPSSGYFTKLEFGKPVIKVPLPEFKINEIDFSIIEKRKKKVKEEAKKEIEKIIKEDINEKINDEFNIYTDKLEFLNEKEREHIIEEASRLSIADENKKLHKKINKHRYKVQEWNKKDNRPEFSNKRYERVKNNPPFLAGVISEESLPRVYRILDTLYRKIEDLGGKINDNLSLKIRYEIVNFKIRESQDKVRHKVTKEEAFRLVSYEDSLKRNKWASKPQIRKWDYVWNGKLIFNINGNKIIKDTKESKIEDRLGDILIELYELSEIIKNKRIEKEKLERKIEEEYRRKKEKIKRYNDEIDKTISLLNMSEDYDKASKIRNFVKALEEKENPEDIKFIKWVNNKADWLDPTIDREDEFLGKRNHGDKKELEDMKKWY